jgi:hypothetical protein
VNLYPYTFRGKFREAIIPDFLKKEVRGFFRLDTAIGVLLGLDTMHYTAEDIKDQTILDRIPNSRADYVPPYSTSLFQITGAKADAYRNGYNTDDVEDFWRTREFAHRKSKLMRPVNTFFDFYMMHIHFADAFQHMTGANQETKPQSLEGLYQELDSLARDILDYFSSEFEHIVFMSDHGLPTKKAHNKNAFYSCNRELFGDKTPHITDFHDKILELAGSDVSDADV